MKQVKTVYRIVIPFLILGVFLFAVGCSSNNGGSESNPNSQQDENLSTLEAVLENTFTGPNQELNRLSNDPENLTVIGKNSETKNPESPNELVLYLEEMYQPHFTEEMYNEYVGKYVFSYQVKENDEMDVNDIDIKPKDSDEIIYDFNANVTYQKEGSEAEIYELKGQTNFSEKGQIQEFKLHSDDGLLEALES
ncbi:hypothetical protein GCM10007063_18440 [Lentibacillus kapialis]|uniref:Lipoprotein n=1 Tax=Lentibacillus kapialis TaxID=340214 RepID=A0A917PX58_9BACI|nr:hypothetical protein [Lentibacillus kapialis]GGJ96346.1 hypothetical protein GCM10007063_18440 [Lentibacillus kapialis]